jgi:leader peptidase (prepilin peptidase)/N-methyltransferase
MSAGVVLPTAALIGALVGAGVPSTARRFTGPPPTAHRHLSGPRDRSGPSAGLNSVGGAVVFGGLAAAVGADAALPALLAVAAVGLVLAVVDLACLRLPDRLVGAAALLGAVGLAGAALVAGTPGRLLLAAAGAAVSFGAYVLLALLPGSRLGFGDVKLATALGLPLGWLGWPTLLLGLLLPHLLHGVLVLGLLAARRVRRHTLLPLGPALLAGAWLAVLFG